MTLFFHYINSQLFNSYTDPAKEILFPTLLRAPASSHGQRTEVCFSISNNILGTLRYCKTATWKTTFSVASQGTHGKQDYDHATLQQCVSSLK